MKDILIFGTWKEATQVIFDINKFKHKIEWDIKAIIDENPKLWGKKWHDIPIVEAWDWLENNKHTNNVICCIGKTSERKRICQRLKKMNYNFPNIISPNAIVSKYAQIGEGNVICSAVQIHPDTIIGDYNMLNIGTHVAHDVKIGSFCNINSHVNLVEKCFVEDMTYIGAGSTIIKESKVGKKSIIGAMSLVNRDIPSGERWVGIPARKI